MSDAPVNENTEKPESDSGHDPLQDSVFLVPYPKIVFMYPSLIMAMVTGIIGLFSDEGSSVMNTCSMIFLMVLAVNLIVISFDFPRTTSLTLFFLLVSVTFGLWLLFSSYPDMLPQVHDVIKSVKPYANSTFYFTFSIFMMMIYAGVMVNVRFDYWEGRPNELLHHHGILSDLERFSSPNLKIEKEINDVFEYLLLRSGRLILHPRNESRSIVLDNVFFINRKEARITKMLSALQVRIKME